ncbi:molybdenum ABC transporter ATP-binding protein [Saccharospirillum mangrovi]|uniref:molybdenum ABC transporter ATP-binding protein n=1 Tax=Saccharospirillum mangrovi TaxID=2161747 RepID=UPI000D3B96BB|nr:molybdenum ABC transporter ATP-binding protein [Saccharospirillum mangrovi]
MTNAIELRLNHRYADFELNVDLVLPGQGITAIYGPSGCGKTTLLRCVAGLERPQSGRVSVAGNVWQDEHQWRPTHQRPLGYVFQEASLFDHLSVAGNLNYARQRADTGEAALTQDAVIELLGLQPLMTRRPAQLSGGERQRVAIARALLINPQLLLMDEPLSALDAQRRADILPYLERLHREFGRPILYVSHAIDEVQRLADHLVLLRDGQVSDSGPLSELLLRADDPLQLGEQQGVVLDGHRAERADDGLMRLSLNGWSLWLPDDGEPLTATVRVRILARDVSLTLSEAHDSSILNRLPATVLDITQLDTARALVRVQIQQQTLLAQLTRRSVQTLQLKPGQSVWAQIKTTALLRPGIV